MQLKIIEVPSIREPIQPSPGFGKKELSDHKLDICGLCGYACVYCSSNHGNYLRMNRKRFADMTEEQTGIRSLPAEDPNLMFIWPDLLKRLTAQLEHKDQSWGAGSTLVYSMLTDGFSPYLVGKGITEKALRFVLERTAFRIRVLTKNAIVGTSRWIRFFREHADRFVIGLSVGTLDDAWATRIERRTPRPSARLRALRAVQDADLATYGMLCPVFPHMLTGNQLETLVDHVRPNLVEHVWAEPYNDRVNWKHVRNCFSPRSNEYRWISAVYEEGHRELWSAYATELYVRLRDKANREGWIEKLRYLLYEEDITEQDAAHFAGLEGIWLQCKPGDDGRSRNPHVAVLQRSRESLRRRSPAVIAMAR